MSSSSTSPILRRNLRQARLNVIRYGQDLDLAMTIFKNLEVEARTIARGFLDFQRNDDIRNEGIEIASYDRNDDVLPDATADSLHIETRGRSHSALVEQMADLTTRQAAAEFLRRHLYLRYFASPEIMATTSILDFTTTVTGSDPEGYELQHVEHNERFELGNWLPRLSTAPYETENLYISDSFEYDRGQEDEASTGDIMTRDDEDTTGQDGEEAPGNLENENTARNDNLGRPGSQSPVRDRDDEDQEQASEDLTPHTARVMELFRAGDLQGLADFDPGSAAHLELMDRDFDLVMRDLHERGRVPVESTMVNYDAVEEDEWERCESEGDIYFMPDRLAEFTDAGVPNELVSYAKDMTYKTRETYAVRDKELTREERRYLCLWLQERRSLVKEELDRYTQYYKTSGRQMDLRIPLEVLQDAEQAMFTCYRHSNWYRLPMWFAEQLGLLDSMVKRITNESQGMLDREMHMSSSANLVEAVKEATQEARMEDDEKSMDEPASPIKQAGRRHNVEYLHALAMSKGDEFQLTAFEWRLRRFEREVGRSPRWMPLWADPNHVIDIAGDSQGRCRPQIPVNFNFEGYMKNIQSRRLDIIHVLQQEYLFFLDDLLETHQEDDFPIEWPSDVCPKKILDLERIHLRLDHELWAGVQDEITSPPKASRLPLETTRDFAMGTVDDLWNDLVLNQYLSAEIPPSLKLRVHPRTTSLLRPRTKFEGKRIDRDSERRKMVAGMDCNNAIQRRENLDNIAWLYSQDMGDSLHHLAELKERQSSTEEELQQLEGNDSRSARRSAKYANYEIGVLEQEIGIFKRAYWLFRILGCAADRDVKELGYNFEVDQENWVARGHGQRWDYMRRHTRVSLSIAAHRRNTDNI